MLLGPNRALVEEETTVVAGLEKCTGASGKGEKKGLCRTETQVPNSVVRLRK